MYTPRPQAPPAFMKRYDAIMKGKERLDTVDKLKDFWLFAIAQGWESYEGREWVAHLTVIAGWQSPILSYLIKIAWDAKKDTIPAWIVNDRFESFTAVEKSPYPHEQTDEEYLDAQWADVQAIVNAFTPERYQGLEESFSYRFFTFKESLRNRIRKFTEKYEKEKRAD